MKFLFATFLFFAIVPAAQAEIENTCVEGDLYNYCITKTVGSKSPDALYVLHGGGGNERVWGNSYQELREALAKKDFQMPAVITVSFGEMWLLVKKSESPNSGLLELFTQKIMPELELKALGHPANKRLLLGHSMGGFNGAQLAMHTPPGTFSRAALLCPAFVDVTPFASLEEKQKLASDLGVPLDAVEGIAEIAQAFAPNNEVWMKDISPFELAPKLLGPQSPELFLAGNKDDKLFFSGGQKFAAIAGATSAATTWEVWNGKHCENDASNDAAVADFLTR